MDSIAGGHIPSLKTCAHESHSRSRQPSRLAFPEVGVVLLPNVSHRRVDIADVAGSGRSTRTFGHAMAGTNDQVVALQIEGFNRQWKEGQIVTVLGERKRQSLDETGSD